MRGIDSNIFDTKGKKSKGRGRGRTPCCDKAHVNRGPWSPAEDLRLISFIQKYGHDNWRALPKLAGLLRCGKSCRLRWVNYLRPDLKRGNFTKEEEETIIRLHRTFGNKWSRIAAHLPGRTDNEIKNVWNTHLKKKLALTASREGVNRESSVITSSSSSSSTVESNQNHQKIEIGSQMNMLPHFGVMKTGQMELSKFNIAPMANQMATLQEHIQPFNDFGFMPQHAELYLDSSGINQLQDFTMWEDPNLQDPLLNVDEDSFNWGLPPPSIQLDPTDINPTHELVTEPDFDLWSLLNYDVVSVHASLYDKEADHMHTMESQNMNAANEIITDKDIDSLLESLENVPEPAQMPSEMFENPGQYHQVDVPNCSSSATATGNGVKEMPDTDYFPMWLPSPSEFDILGIHV